MLFDLPLDRHQRDLAARALADAGAPFDPADRARFREGARRVWERYQQALARSTPPFFARAAHLVDRAVFERRREEHLDDPSLPAARRERLQRSLDRLNRTIGTYQWVFRALERLAGAAASPGAGGELSVLDVGSGHGAFPIKLAERGHLGGARVRVVGSDVEPAYVAAAAEAAARAGAAVEFRRIDALELDRLDERFDLIVCTQTVHHFPPEFVAELIARARANARRGVLLFDARRSALAIAFGSPGLLAVSGADPMFVHDGVVSLRRMYSPAEFELLSRCAPGGEALTARNYGPVYVVAQATADHQ